MNGIDAGAAALLANRAGSLSPVGSQSSTGATQAGVSARATGASALADAGIATPQASAQTELSAVALALDAIIRSGGDATPAVVGDAPVWSDPDSATAQALPQSQSQPGTPGAAAALAAEVEAIDAVLLAEAADAASPIATSTDDAAAGLAGSDAASDAQAAASSGTASAAGNANASASANAASASALAASQAAVQSAPLAALAAALAQTVSGSGLFYESHLAQWLLGQRTPAALADEPQNQLVARDGQASSGSGSALVDADDALWDELPAQGTRDPQTSGANSTNNANGQLARYAGAQGDAAMPTSSTALVRANAALAETALLSSESDAQSTGSSTGTGVHSAVIPLVRQQLDLLATGEFRWTGEAWSGVRLDWTIQQDRVDARDPRRGTAAEPVDAPWRTRLTLSLPLLGTVDAELTLAGDALAVRVQAHADGAQRLVAGSDGLRQRLEALGLALTGLSIREVGGNGPGSAEASKAASAAYARAAAQEPSAHAGETPAAAAAAGAGAGTGSLDWEL